MREAATKCTKLDCFKQILKVQALGPSHPLQIKEKKRRKEIFILLWPFRKKAVKSAMVPFIKCVPVRINENKNKMITGMMH